MQRKLKSKKNQMLYIWLQACILGDVGVIGCTSKVKVPIKKSDMSVKYKRQLNLTHYKHEPQNSLA